MYLWPRRRTVPPAETRGTLDEALASAELYDASQPLEDWIREADSVTRPLPPGSTGTAPTRATLPTGDGATDMALKSSYLTMDTANRARKISLYQAWRGEAWVAACCEAIAARMVSGGWTLKAVDPLHPNNKTKGSLQEYLDWCNPDEDFHQIVHAIATDLLWCGESYLEITTKRNQALRREVPYELYTVDPISMDYVLAQDRKSIAGYTQIADGTAPIRLGADQILRIWLPDPRNRFKALSPLEKLLNPVTLDTYLQLSEQKYFQLGNRGEIAITLPNAKEETAGRFLKWIRERFVGVKNAHLPLILFGEEGDVQITQVSDRGKLEIIPRRTLCRDEILAGYKVPPHLVSALEGTGQGGQAVGDTMEKQFIHTAVDPLRMRLYTVR